MGPSLAVMPSEIDAAGEENLGPIFPDLFCGLSFISVPDLEDFSPIPFDGKVQRPSVFTTRRHKQNEPF